MKEETNQRGLYLAQHIHMHASFIERRERLKERGLQLPVGASVVIHVSVSSSSCIHHHSDHMFLHRLEAKWAVNEDESLCGILSKMLP